MSKGGYPKRTEQNIIDSDATVIFTFGKLKTGSALTARLAKQYNKPWLHMNLSVTKEPVDNIKDWLIEWDVKVLNVAGNRESSSPGIYEKVKKIILEICR